MNKRNCFFIAMGLLAVLLCGLLLVSTQTGTFRADLLPGPKSVIEGSGIVVNEARDVSGVDSAVLLRAPGELTITRADTQSLSIEAEDNLMGIIQTRVENGVLVIQLTMEPNVSLQLTHPIRYLLALKNLDSIEVVGSGSVKAMNLQTESLKATLSGGGEMNLAGHTTSQVIEINGGSLYQAGDLESQNVTISVMGSADATIWVTERLNVTCKGGCAINYYGNPELEKNVSAVGVVTSLGNK